MGTVIDFEDRAQIKQISVHLQKTAEQRAVVMKRLAQYNFATPLAVILDGFARGLHMRMVDYKDILDFTDIDFRIVETQLNDADYKIKYCKLYIKDSSAIAAPDCAVVGLDSGSVMFSLSMHYGSLSRWVEHQPLNKMVLLEKAEKLFTPHVTEANCGYDALRAYLEELLVSMDNVGYVYYPYWDNNVTDDRLDRVAFYAVCQDICISVVVHGERYLKHLTILNTPTLDTEVQTT